MTLVNNPHTLVPSQEDSRGTKKQRINPKGEFDCNFTLYIALTEEASKNPKNYRYCRKAGKKVPVNGTTFYSKFLGKLEPTPEKVLENFTRIVRNWSSGNDMAYAVIYWNVNRGNRVKYHFQACNIDKTEVQNVELMRFDKRGKTAYSAAKMFSVPLFHTEEASYEKINAYYQNLMHYIPEQQALAVYEYLDYYYNPEKSKKLYPVEISQEPPKPKTDNDLYQRHFDNESELLSFCKKQKESGEYDYQLLREFYKDYKDTYFRNSPTAPKVQNEPSTPETSKEPTPVRNLVEEVAQIAEGIKKVMEFASKPLPAQAQDDEEVLQALTFELMQDNMSFQDARSQAVMISKTPAFATIKQNYYAKKQEEGISKA